MLHIDLRSGDCDLRVAQRLSQPLNTQTNDELFDGQGSNSE